MRLWPQFYQKISLSLSHLYFIPSNAWLCLKKCSFSSMNNSIDFLGRFLYFPTNPTSKHRLGGSRANKVQIFADQTKFPFFSHNPVFLIFNRMKVLFVIFRQSSGPSTFSDLFSAKPAAHSQRRGAAITAKREEFIKIVDGDNHTIQRSYHHTIWV